MTGLLYAIVRESGIVQSKTQRRGVDALIASLRNGNCVSVEPILAFLDDCSARLARKPVKYQDDLDALCHLLQSDSVDRLHGPISMLWMSMIEQWPFVAKSQSENATKILEWLASFWSLCKYIGEDDAILSKIRDTIVDRSDPVECKEMFSRFDNGYHELENRLPGFSPAAIKPNGVTMSSGGVKKDSSTLIEQSIPAEEDENHPGINKWSSKEVEEVVEDGDLTELILCLCSKHLSIRQQAMTNIRMFRGKLKVRALVQSWGTNLTLFPDI